MVALVVYDSRRGYTGEIAQVIGEAAGGRLLRVGLEVF
jgi:flavodoxin